MASVNNLIGLKGFGEIEIHSAISGELLEKIEYENVITKYVKDAIIASFTGTAINWNITYIAIGSGAAAPHEDDTELDSEVYRSQPTQIINYSSKMIGFRLFLSASQNNGTTFREIGLFDASTAGNMYARSTDFQPIQKNANITITFTHKLSIS